MSKTHQFQAEVSQLLHLVTHALYSNPEIFLRELVSNASDACDKLRFKAIDHPQWYGDDAELKIRIAYDKDAKTITISDNGIGMNEQEAIDNLGTIAKSGTKDFMSKLSGEQQSDAQLIGQFGVGFYSGFIVADKITVESKSASQTDESGNNAIRWVSDGTGSFDLTSIQKSGRGTDVILHVREEHEEFLNNWKLKSIVQKYSDHISLPIQMQKEEWQDGEENQPGQMIKTDEWESINSASALWTRSKSDITEDQYIEFYKQIAHDHEAPLTWTHNRVEGKTEYTQLLYIPTKAPYDFWQRDHKSGVKLYVKRVFIMDNADNLLPNYLRFIKGVVDSSDLPLNVSRELLQESRDVKAIREGNARRALSMLEQLANSDDADEVQKYLAFFKEFGNALKEGLAEDPTQRDKLASLLRFASTKEADTKVSFADYKARMKEGQDTIYYLTADNMAGAQSSPQLELFKKKDIEVLIMGERIDEWAMNFLNEFDGVKLQNVAKGAVDLGDLQDEAEKEAVAKANEAFKDVLERINKVLSEQVKEVRLTNRLVDSPSCIVVSEGEISPQMAQLLKQAGQEVPEIKPVLEVNPEHPLVKKLEASPDFDDLVHILLDQAMIADGGVPTNPAVFIQRMNRLLM